MSLEVGRGTEGGGARGEPPQRPVVKRTVSWSVFPSILDRERPWTGGPPAEALESGAASDWPLELSYVPDVPSEHLDVHAGRLVDGLSPEARHDVDILVGGNRIVGVAGLRCHALAECALIRRR